jgi:hypothetical protein
MTIELPPAPGQSTLSGAGEGSVGVVGLASTGLALGVACTGVGDADRAASEPGEAPTLQALKTAISAKSPANRPIEG